MILIVYLVLIYCKLQILGNNILYKEIVITKHAIKHHIHRSVRGITVSNNLFFKLFRCGLMGVGPPPPIILSSKIFTRQYAL